MWRGRELLKHRLRKSRHPASAFPGHAHSHGLTSVAYLLTCSPPLHTQVTSQHCLHLTGANDVRAFKDPAPGLPGSGEVRGEGFKGQQAGSELTATQPHCTHHHGSPLRGTQTLGPYGRREIVPGHPRKESRITEAQPQLS